MTKETPVLVRGKLFASARECADHFGIHISNIYTALAWGKIDSVGLRGPYPKRPENFIIGEFTFKSQRAAASFIGIAQSTLQDWNKTKIGREKLLTLLRAETDRHLTASGNPKETDK